MIWSDRDYIIPVLVAGCLRGATRDGDQVTITVDGKTVPPYAVHWLGTGPGASFEVPIADFFAAGANPVIRAINARTGAEMAGSPLRLTGGHGRIAAMEGDCIGGYVEPDAEGQAPTLVAFTDTTVLALAVSGDGPVRRTPAGIPFALPLPALPPGSASRHVQVGIVGTDAVLGPWDLRQCPPRTIPKVTNIRTVPKVIAIKIATPNLRVAHEWGDYHFANAMKKQFERLGWLARIDCHDRWYTNNNEVDYTITLRGRQPYKADAAHRNLVWVISHPDRVNEGELDQFDHVFVASDIYARILQTETTAPVSVLHQASDPEVFYPAEDPVRIHEVLFIGNSRREYRAMVQWCIDQGIDVSVFGSLWQDVIPPHLLKGEHILNDEVYRYYSGCRILLNDHWDTMRDNGFLSNRLFDGSAAGAFILTDPVLGLAEVFGDTIATAATPEQFRDQVAYYLAHPEEARAKAEAARRIVLNNHTFAHRVAEIIRTIQSLEQHVAPRPRMIHSTS